MLIEIMNDESVFIEFRGRNIEFTSGGYLKNFGEWSEDLARYLCEQDGIKLTQDHWDVIMFMREYYTQFKMTPMPRVIINRLNDIKHTDRYGIRYLYKLFPPAPVRHACKYAGVPEPEGCT
ncbi:MAG: TusE/DsrC/DsvC family sulfur relay protein [Nitrospirae bacterium]|nr:TusE/DsrC/DsvC family sulfur relay protein [Nitrospirota bacterium]